VTVSPHPISSIPEFKQFQEEDFSWIAWSWWWKHYNPSNCE